VQTDRKEGRGAWNNELAGGVKVNGIGWNVGEVEAHSLDHASFHEHVRPPGPGRVWIPPGAAHCYIIDCY